MTRRVFLWLLAAAGFALKGRDLAAQDVEYGRAMDRAQRTRPSALAATARIAPASEPGDPLRVRGQLRNLGGAAAAGAVVFAYHTDRGGLYDDPAKGPHSWRLRGWARTDRDGRFTFETMRPGAYPGGNIPPHVHFTAFLADGSRYHTPQLNLPATRVAPAGQPEEISVELRPRASDRF
jgi:protocatechuate 3,4-dioxygenase beta subunit